LYSLCASQFWGGWNHTCWPLNFRLRWPHASRLSSCGLSVYRSLFSSFSFPFPSIPLLLLLSSGNRTAKSVPISFCSRDLPESYLLLFFSPTFFLHPCLFNLLRPCGKYPSTSIVYYARTHRYITASTSEFSDR
jgi:hypothetical protein